MGCGGTLGILAAESPFRLNNQSRGTQFVRNQLRTKHPLDYAP